MSKIEHPDHYNCLPNNIECIDVVKHFDFCLGNVIKYIWRAGLKPGSSKFDDLQKAKKYIEFALSDMTCVHCLKREAEPHPVVQLCAECTTPMESKKDAKAVVITRGEKNG